MKAAVSSVDVRVLARELDVRLSGARVDKVYQVGGKEIVLTLRKPGSGGIELVCAPNFICTTSYKRKPPKSPSSFAMQLRKELGGGMVAGVRQHAFDRILELDFETKSGGRTLVCELFSKGNMILLDGGRKILGLIEWQRWRDRKLGVRQAYEHPPSGANPLELGERDFGRLLSESGKDVVRTLAVDAGLGGTYAEEVCMVAGVDKNKVAGAVSPKEAAAIYASLKGLLSRVCGGEYSPRIVLESGGRVDVTPFELEVYAGMEAEEFPSFNEAVDEYFSTLERTAVAEEREKRVSGELGKLRAIEAKQAEKLAKLAEDAGEFKQAGDLIYAHMNEIGEIIGAVKKARQKGLGDKKITAEFRKAAEAGTTPAKLVKKIDKNKLILGLE